MKEEIKLISGYDPDKFRDELCENSWKQSGANTLDEYVIYIKEKHRKFSEKRKAEKAQKVANENEKKNHDY